MKQFHIDPTRRNGATGLGHALAVVLFAAIVAIALPAGPALSQQQPGVAESPTEGNVPGRSLGNTSDSEFWRAIRQGEAGMVSIPDQQAAILIQSEGESWRSIRNGPVSVYGVWVIMGMIILLALFFAIRGRITIEHGESGELIRRFNSVERFAHWLTAASFIVLALTGLNMLYGRYFLPAVIGPEAFHVILSAGRHMHHYLAFAFMAGLALEFVLWVRHNIPNRLDLIWLAKGGGLFTKGVHPSSKKFNAGQKFFFWVTILGGISLSMSGWALLYPFTTSFFADTFAVLNLVGFNLPTDLTPMQEQQLSQLWHASVSMVMIAPMLSHIYIDSLVMQGAFSAMGSGWVDVNWAKEHHDLWVAEERAKAAQRAPAE